MKWARYDLSIDRSALSIIFLEELVVSRSKFLIFHCTLQFWRDVAAGQGNEQFHICFLFFVLQMYIFRVLGYACPLSDDTTHLGQVSREEEEAGDNLLEPEHEDEFERHFPLAELSPGNHLARVNLPSPITHKIYFVKSNKKRGNSL